MAENSMIIRHEGNQNGIDYVVGDIHGQFSVLQQELDRIGFNPECDRLFSVGDLIDRGPESHLVTDWLTKPWFLPSLGNHDEFACQYQSEDDDLIGTWMRNGGGWFVSLSETEQATVSAALQQLPLVREVHYPNAVIGIVHAGWRGPWQTLRDIIGLDGGMGVLARETLLWDRSRVHLEIDDHVSGITAVVCGHTPVKEPLVLGNVHHIDTMGWVPEKGFKFTILKLPELVRV